VKRFCIIVFLG